MSVANAQSESWRHRQQGNVKYGAAKAEGLAPSVSQQRYEESLKCYFKALSHASNDVERSSAYKNIALANWRLAEVIRSRAEKSISTRTAADLPLSSDEIYRWKEAMLNFSRAKRSGEGSNRDNALEWVGDLITSMTSCFDSLRLTCLEYGIYRNRIEFWCRLQRDVHPAEAMVWQVFQYVLCDMKFNESVRCREAGNYVSAISAAQSCLQDVMQLADSCQRHGEHFASFVEWDLDDTVTETSQQERICRSMQACAVGDAVLQRSLSSSEDLAIDLVWDAVDHFHDSLVLARDHEVEQEAIAYSRLAKVFDAVLKINHKAVAYSKRAVELAESLMPRNLHTEEWYRTAMAVVAKNQRERMKAEEDKKEEMMKKYKEELKDELAALKDLVKEKPEGAGKPVTLQQILVFIYTNHPPKNSPDYELPKKIPADDLKKLYRKALGHYHPDKVDKEKHGMQWYVLCDEISKVLSSRYQNLKELD